MLKHCLFFAVNVLCNVVACELRPPFVVLTVCEAGVEPCNAGFACVTKTCVEAMSGAAQCSVSVEHGLCGSA
jgi:hypothetical protein